MGHLRILLVHNILWSHYKAAVFSELAKICDANGYVFQVVHIAKTDKSRKTLSAVDEGLHHYRYTVIHDGAFEETTLLRRLYALLKVIREYKPDVLIVPGYFDMSWVLASYLSKLRGCKIIMTSDSTIYDSPRHWLKELTKKFILKPYNLLFCYGSMAKSYLKHLEVPERKIMIRYQATQSSQTRALYLASKSNSRKQHLNKKNFIYVGRFAQEKNLFLMLRAFEGVRDKDWGLIMVGSGPQEANLKDYVASKKINNVFFVGPKSWREVIEYYASADCLVLPSLSEPWGLVVNEAMICGLPVVVSSHCGASAELVSEGKNGFVFDPNSEGELREIMKAFVSNRYDLTAMGKKSFEIIQNYSPENSARQMYDGILKVSG